MTDLKRQDIPLHCRRAAGLALYPDHAGDEAALFRSADAAMYLSITPPSK